MILVAKTKQAKQHPLLLDVMLSTSVILGIIDKNIEDDKTLSWSGKD